MEITLKVDDFLTSEEQKEIVTEEFRNSARSLMKGPSGDIDRILSNAAYRAVFTETDRIADMRTIHAKLVANVRRIVNDGANYSVFREKSSYNSESAASMIVRHAVMAQKETIADKAGEALDGLDIDDMSERVNETLYQVLHDMVRGAGKKED